MCKTNMQSNEQQDSEWLRKEYKKRKKSIFVAYYFCLLMSGFGLHKFYLGDKAQAVKFASLYWVGLLVFAAGFSLMEVGQFTIGASSFVIGIATLFIFGVWWILDIVTLYIQTKRKNAIILQQLSSMEDKLI